MRMPIGRGGRWHSPGRNKSQSSSAVLFSVEMGDATFSIEGVETGVACVSRVQEGSDTFPLIDVLSDATIES